jgi:hypothetical protein
MCVPFPRFPRDGAARIASDLLRDGRFLCRLDGDRR